MSNKEELRETSEKLKDSIEDQIEDVKEKLEKYGKIGLYVGGGLLGVYLLTKIFGNDDEEVEVIVEEVKPKKKKKRKYGKLKHSEPNFLMDALKEQAIIFGLGMAAEQLRSFLNNLNNNEETDSE